MTDTQRRIYLGWVNQPEQNPLIGAMLGAIVRTTGRSPTWLRRDLLADRDWFASDFFQERVQPAEVGDGVLSVQPVDPLRLRTLALHPDPRDRPLRACHRRLVALAHEEAGRLIGTKLADFDAPSVATLPPRMRQVLACLLEGDSEKQVATRLGISRHTVHEHVKRLHRHFGVSSRGELFARCHGLYAVLAGDARPSTTAGEIVTPFGNARRRPGHPPNSHR